MLRGKFDFIVVGAGIAGLSLAVRLLDAGRSVLVVERGRAGQAASWAAAGMLAASIEHGEDGDEVIGFGREAQLMWPGFAEELKLNGGIDPQLIKAGTILTSLQEGRKDWLASKYEEAKARDLNCHIVDREALSIVEPNISDHCDLALHFPDDHQVNNRRVCRALCNWVQRSGGTILEDTAVIDISTSAGRAVGVETERLSFRGEVTVLANGAWMPSLLDGALPLEPVKGQAIAIDQAQSIKLRRHNVYCDDVYLVPKRNGHVVVGATTERVGFDNSLTEIAFEFLNEGACKVIPALGECDVAEHWFGFRPVCIDEAPVLGASGVEGLYLLGGCYRNGILHAPMLSKVMSDHLLLGRDSHYLEHFSPSRFVSAS